MNARFAAVWRSFMGMPLWVKIWVTLLATTNTASLGFLGSDIGLWTAVSFGVVCAFNVPMMLIQNGLTRLMSFPHFVWVPLLVFIYPQLFGANALAPGSAVYILGLAVFAMNGISLLFDVYECVGWLRGERGVMGIG